ncbi:hypothetical protein GJ744_001618 [Endocarpon pusillum]|uniref:Uncharacterized protein n=1 Tax=Endocarpon pusillum TaxID=364733 RepID=A0A8H7E0I1_9EURO|nr:hypothetical protein GJ744_001618 [Endocarpon pusillum]
MPPYLHLAILSSSIRSPLYLLYDLLQPQQLASVQDPQPIAARALDGSNSGICWRFPMPDSMLGRNLQEMPERQTVGSSFVEERALDHVRRPMLPIRGLGETVSGSHVLFTLVHGRLMVKVVSSKLKGRVEPPSSWNLQFVCCQGVMPLYPCPTQDVDSILAWHRSSGDNMTEGMSITGPLTVAWLALTCPDSAGVLAGNVVKHEAAPQPPKALLDRPMKPDA